MSALTLHLALTDPFPNWIPWAVGRDMVHTEYSSHACTKPDCMKDPEDGPEQWVSKELVDVLTDLTADPQADHFMCSHLKASLFA